MPKSTSGRTDLGPTRAAISEVCPPSVVTELALGQDRGRFWPRVPAAAACLVKPSGRTESMRPARDGSWARTGIGCARVAPRSAPDGRGGDGRYRLGTLDAVLHGPVVMGALLGETPSPPARLLGHDNASGTSGPQIERGPPGRQPGRTEETGAGRGEGAGPLSLDRTGALAGAGPPPPAAGRRSRRVTAGPGRRPPADVPPAGARPPGHRPAPPHRWP